MKHEQTENLVFESIGVKIPREYWHKATGEDVKVVVGYAYDTLKDHCHVYNIGGGLTQISRIDIGAECKAFLNSYCLMDARKKYKKQPRQVSEIIADMPELHPPVSVDERGELRSCVDMAERKFNVQPEDF